MSKFWDWIKSWGVWSAFSKKVTPAKPTEPAAGTPDTQATVSGVKITHGNEVALVGGEGGDYSFSTGGVAFRAFEIKSDQAIGRAVQSAKAVTVTDGKMLANDFVNAAGQILVWQYWTVGTSKMSAKSENNPETAKNDTRVWYRCYEKAAP